MAAELFHAYVIGGERETARAHLLELLAEEFAHAGNPNLLVTEHVTFTIDNAHMLREWQELSPVGDARKIYVIFTDFMTREAENALLKTLEEPTPRTHIFIAIPKPALLLPTLLSRVRVIIPESARANTALAEKFLQLSLADRLAAVSAMIEKEDSEDAAALVREKAIGFLNQIEAVLSIDIEKNKLQLERLLDLKKYLYVPGASVRIILESLALTI